MSFAFFPLLLAFVVVARSLYVGVLFALGSGRRVVAHSSLKQHGLVLYAHNNRTTIEAAITSIIAANIAGSNVTLIVNASKDNSAQFVRSILKKYPDFKPKTHYKRKYMPAHVLLERATSQEATVMTGSERVVVRSATDYEITEVFDASFRGLAQGLRRTDKILRKSIMLGPALSRLLNSWHAHWLYELFAVSELVTLVIAITLAINGTTTQALTLILLAHFSWLLTLVLHRHVSPANFTFRLLTIALAPAIYCVALITILVGKLTPGFSKA